MSSSRHRQRRDPRRIGAPGAVDTRCPSYLVPCSEGGSRQRARSAEAMSLMSGRSAASGSVRSCGGSVRLGPPPPSHDHAATSPYDRKRDKKTVRVLTVIVYVFCVSLAAIMLSLYYVFFWEPKDAQHAQRKVSHTVEKQTSTTRMPTCFMPHTGRSRDRCASLLPSPFRLT